MTEDFCLERTRRYSVMKRNNILNLSRETLSRLMHMEAGRNMRTSDMKLESRFSTRFCRISLRREEMM